MKKLLVLLTIVALVFSLASCALVNPDAPCTHAYDNACDADCNTCGAPRTPASHVDEIGDDGKCDVCGEDMPTVTPDPEPEIPDGEDIGENVTPGAPFGD